MKVKNKKQHHKNITGGSSQAKYHRWDFLISKNDYRSITIAFISNAIIQNQNQILILPLIKHQILILLTLLLNLINRNLNLILVQCL